MKMQIARMAFRVTTASAALMAIAAPMAVQAQEPAISFNIPSQNLSTALREFAKQSRHQVAFDEAAAAGKTSRALTGSHRPAEGLKILLSGSSFTIERGRSGLFMLRPRRIFADATPVEDDAAAPAPEIDDNVEILVTGTLIRGEVPVGSPLKSYARKDMIRTGATTLEQFARTMSENFSSSDTVSNAAASSSRFTPDNSANEYNGAAFNLRGVGPSATLTLLNGNRLAPGGATGGFVDISLIPISVIDRIEVMADGASAIYGADAVAGVVNIITRDNFKGAETTGQYGLAGDGSAEQFTLSQLVGTAWTSGNAMLAYQHSEQDALDVSEREYLPQNGGRYSLLPQTRADSLFFSLKHSLASRTHLSAHGIYTDRSSRLSSYATSDFNDTQTDQSSDQGQIGASVGIEQGFASDWTATLTGNFARLKQSNLQATDNTAFADSLAKRHAKSQIYSGDLVAQGSVISLPAGSMKAALGASYKKEQFENSISAAFDGGGSAEVILPKLSRSVESLFGELRVPVIGRSDGSGPRLEISGALRYDHYSDFGSTTNYRLGAGATIVEGVTLRGTYGSSFRAPQLSDLGAAQFVYALPVANPAAPGGSTNTIFIQGGNPRLGPEKSTSFTIGLDLAPVTIPDFRFAITYFDIDYRDRIAPPPIVGNPFLEPAGAAFLDTNPSGAAVAALFATPGFLNFTDGGPQDIGAVYDARTTNIASTDQTGLDISTSYRFDTPSGAFGISASTQRLFKNDYRVTPTSAAVRLLNVFAQPLKWKARAALDYGHDGFFASITGNYANAYRNGLGGDGIVPGSSARIGAWTTFDFFASYLVQRDQGILEGLSFSLAVNNLTNKRPPRVDFPPILLQPGDRPLPFDAANASALGRFISFSVSKKW
jgi:outer membrane receptor protein involved in Fe transport